MNALSRRSPSLNFMTDDANSTATYIALSINGMGASGPSEVSPLLSILNTHELKILTIESTTFSAAAACIITRTRFEITPDRKINGIMTGPLTE